MTQFSEPVQQSIRQTLDTAIGVGAVSSPVWLNYIEAGGAVVMAVGGSILVGIRVYLAIKELKRKAK